MKKVKELDINEQYRKEERKQEVISDVKSNLLMLGLLFALLIPFCIWLLV